MPYRDKRGDIDNMTHIYLLTSDPKNEEVQLAKNRREDLIQFQQYTALGSPECFLGGTDPKKTSQRVTVEKKLLDILDGTHMTAREKEQSVLVYCAAQAQSLSLTVSLTVTLTPSPLSLSSSGQ